MEFTPRTKIFKTDYPNAYYDFKNRKCTLSHFYQILICGFKSRVLKTLFFKNAPFKMAYPNKPSEYTYSISRT